jgi:hypothetical protein
MLIFQNIINSIKGKLVELYFKITINIHFKILLRTIVSYDKNQSFFCFFIGFCLFTGFYLLTGTW